jgi:hypothetical protein
MAEYEVTRRINAVVSVTINASSPEEAKEKSEKEFKKGIFKSNITYVDGNEALIGIANLDLWNTDIE